MPLLADREDGAVIDFEGEGVLAGGEGAGGEGVDVGRGEGVAGAEELAIEERGALPHDALEEELVIASHVRRNREGLGVRGFADILMARSEGTVDGLRGGGAELRIAQRARKRQGGGGSIGERYLPRPGKRERGRRRVQMRRKCAQRTKYENSESVMHCLPPAS